MANHRSLPAEADVRIVNNKVMAMEGTTRTSSEINALDLGGLPNTAKFKKDINMVIGNGKDLIVSGTLGYSAPIAFSGTITSWSLAEVSNPSISGTISIDILKSSSTNYPPDQLDSLTGGNKPQLNNERLRFEDDLTGWDLNLLAGDSIGFSVETSSRCKSVHLVLSVEVGF
jgi:hypothetical protein